MKRILGLAALIGQLLASAVGKETGIEPAQYRRQYGVKRQVRQAYHACPRPTDARWWHDLKQPIQCRKLQAAKDKREERAVKASYHAMRTLSGMHAVICEAYAKHDAGYACPLNLNPFYIAK